jgi:hypothetical protein
MFRSFYLPQLIGEKIVEKNLSKTQANSAKNEQPPAQSLKLRRQKNGQYTGSLLG